MARFWQAIADPIVGRLLEPADRPGRAIAHGHVSWRNGSASDF
jgi:hypothetical protein